MPISTTPAISGTDLNTVSGVAASSATTKTTLSLTATATQQLQAIGPARKLLFGASGTGAFYIKFSDGMSSLSVATTDTLVSLTATTTVSVAVPSGYMYYEFLRSGSDFAYTVGLQS